MMEFTFNWLAALATVAGVIIVVLIAQNILFRIPALAAARAADRQKNKEKFDRYPERYRRRVPASQKIGLTLNLIFYALCLPFIVSFEPQSVGRVLLDCFLILMVYDFFYYLTHRFVFHGKGYFLRVHGVHHQARSRVSSVDSFLLHPAELFVGIALFYVTTASVALFNGQQFHVATIIICNVIYTQLNQLNHCRVDLDSSPWKLFSWIAIRHDAHHLGMTKGNYATITLLYDWMFGTLETHPLEQSKEASAEQ